jgi:hypothetical protein
VERSDTHQFSRLLGGYRCAQPTLQVLIGNWLLLVRSHFVLLRCNREIDMLLDVVDVKVQEGNALFLEFENGEKRSFDMTSYLNERPFNRLKDSHLFAMAKVDYGTVVWPGNIDIAPETLYDASVPLPQSKN